MQCVKLCERCLPLWRVFVLAVACLRLMLIISIVAIHIIPAAGVRWTAFVAVVIGAAAAVAGISWSRTTLRSIRLRLMVCIVLGCIWCLRWMLEWPRWWLLMWIGRWQWWLLLIVRWLCGILIVIVIICIIVSVARTIETRHTADDVLLILMCVFGWVWMMCVCDEAIPTKWNKIENKMRKRQIIIMSKLVSDGRCAGGWFARASMYNFQFNLGRHDGCVYLINTLT